MSDHLKLNKRPGTKKFRTKFLAELEILKKDPLYSRALEEVILIEKKKNEVRAIELNLNVQYATIFGEKMAVVGGCDALGNWDPSRAVEMNWSERNIWRATALANGDLSEVPYKYICIRGTLVKWEAGDNRIIDPRKGERCGNRIKVIMEDIWKGN